MLGENNPICIFYHCYCMMSYYRWWLKQVSYPSVDNRANCKLQHFSERYCSYSCDIVCLTFSGPIYCYCHYICARVNKNKTRLERCWENILCLQCSAHICDMCCLLVKSFAQIKKTTKLEINLDFKNHVPKTLKLNYHCIEQV